MRKLAKLGLAVLAVGAVLYFLSGLSDGLKAGSGPVGSYVQARNAALGNP